MCSSDLPPTSFPLSFCHQPKPEGGVIGKPPERSQVPDYQSLTPHSLMVGSVRQCSNSPQSPVLKLVMSQFLKIEPRLFSSGILDKRRLQFLVSTNNRPVRRQGNSNPPTGEASELSRTGKYYGKLAKERFSSTTQL